MYCRKCGKEVDDEAVVCIHCGCALREYEQRREYNEPKTGIGILMGLFLGIIGLIIGICLYPDGTVARRTFMKAWGITFAVCAGIGIISYICLLIFAGSIIGSIPF